MAMALRRSSPAPCIPEGITPDAPAARINGVFLLPMTADLRSAAMLDPRRYQCPHSIAKGDYRDALLPGRLCRGAPSGDDFARPAPALALDEGTRLRSEEHTSELQSLMRISYAVFCLKKKNTHTNIK